MKRAEATEIWRKRLKDCERSGLTIEKFCKREGVSTATFFKWRRRLAEAEQPLKMEFVELGANGKGSRIEVVTKSGMLVRLGEDFDAATLKRLLDVLDGR